MLVSYVIPVYNMENYIRQCITSVFLQILPHGVELEIIVVNDASTDTSMHQITKVFEDRFGQKYFNHVTGYKILDLKANHGAGNALYEGFKLASGDYICYLSADDILHNHFKTMGQLRSMERNNSDLSYCDSYIIGEDINHVNDIRSSFIYSYKNVNKVILSNNLLTYFFLNLKNPINSSTFMIKSQSIEKYGNWDPTLKGDCDGDILLRWSLHGAKISEVRCDKSIFYRLHENQLSNNPSLMSETMLYNRKKYAIEVLSGNYPIWIKLLVKLFVRLK